MAKPTTAASAPDAYSFSATIEDQSFFSCRAVTNSRIEILCIEEGTGVFVIGKERVRFGSGDVFMTGTQLCHQYKLDEEYMGRFRDRVKVKVVRFLPDFWGETFLNLHENAYIKVLLGKADLGIMPGGVTRKRVRGLLQKVMQATGTGKIILLLEMLHALSISEDLRFLLSADVVSAGDDTGRMDRIYTYSREHFNRKIDLEEIAAVAYVSPNSFCRYFKTRAKKTYSRFLIELRVRHACNLLVEGRLCTKRICVESGFNNFSNFHKCFKEVVGMSPVEYQKEFKSVALFG